MKASNRLILTLLILLGTYCIAPAQLRYGFRFGGDFAKASFKDASVPGILANLDFKEYKGMPYLINRSGFSGGLVLEYQFEKCGFAPDIALLYTRYNTRLAVAEQKPESFGRNFLEIPIHLKWKFWIPQTKNLFAPMIYTGPSLMFRLDHKEGIPYNILYTNTTSPTTSDKTNESCFTTNTLQPGWDVGIGFDVINFIQITAGYRFGLGNAAKSPDTVTLHTNAWTVAATILFDF